MKTGRRKRLIVTLVILALILISAAFIIPKLLDLNQYRGWIASKIEDAAQGKVKIGQITWGISDGIWVKTDALSITEAASLPVDLHLSDIYIRLAVSPLLSERIEIKKLTFVVVIPKTNETQSGEFSIKLKGRIDDWQKEPVVLIRSLSTSSIPLNPVVSMIPWEQMGDKANSVKKILLAGGSLKINNLNLPGINVKNPPKDIKKVIAKIKAAISIADIEIHPYPAFPVFDGISGNVSIDKGVLDISEAQGRMGPFTFPSIKLQVSGFNDDLQVTASLKGPIKVIGTDNKAIKEFLKDKGFKSLTGVTDIDMNFKYFQKQPEDWVANGSLIIKGVNAESYPKGVHLDNLQGKILFSRAKTTQLTVENLSAKINTAPVNLAGKLTGGRTADMVIDGKADIKGLDLAEFGSLLPYLDYLKLTGKLDLDLDFKIPYGNPADTRPVGIRLDGTVNADQIGFHLPDYNMVAKDTNIEIKLDSDSVQLIKMDMNINDQVLHLKGNISDPAEPKINLLVQSPGLDVDRLLPGDKKMTEPPQKNKKKKDLKQALPSWAGNLTIDLRGEIDKGKYHDQPFEDLNLTAHYEKGLLQDYTVNLHLAKGKIITTGSADLRDPEKISFVMNPDISNVQIGELSSLFKVEKMPLDGPLSINGRLEGKAGNVKELLPSLSGTLRVDAGPGRIPEAKYLGKLITEILNFVNIRDLFSGALTDTMQNKGLPFKTIKSEYSFSNGNMNIDSLLFISDSLNGNSQGVINFVDEKIALQVVIEPLQTINKVLNLVPVLGKHAQKITNIHIMVKGPLDDPEVKTLHTKGVADAIKGTLGIPGAIFKDPDELSGEIDEYMKKEAEKPKM